MTVSARDPAGMTAEDRLAELAEVIANAYLRLLARRQKELEADPKAEALLGVVDGKDTVARKEQA